MPQRQNQCHGLSIEYFFHVPYGSLAGSSVPATNSLALLHHRGNTGTPHVDNLPSIVGWKPLSFSLAKTSNHREFQLWWSKDFRMPWSREQRGCSGADGDVELGSVVSFVTDGVANESIGAFDQYQWIGLRDNWQENPIFHRKIMENRWFPVDFPLNHSTDNRYQ